MTSGSYDPQVQTMVEVLTENGFPTLGRYLAEEMDPRNTGGPSDEVDAVRTCVEDAVRTVIESRSK